jgi:hypothetical protein
MGLGEMGLGEMVLGEMVLGDMDIHQVRYHWKDWLMPNNLQSPNFGLICIYSGDNLHMKNTTLFPLFCVSCFSCCCIRFNLPFTTIYGVRGLFPTTFKILGMNFA